MNPTDHLKKTEHIFNEVTSVFFKLLPIHAFKAVWKFSKVFGNPLTHFYGTQGFRGGTQVGNHCFWSLARTNPFQHLQLILYKDDREELARVKQSKEFN